MYDRYIYEKLQYLHALGKTFSNIANVHQYMTVVMTPWPSSSNKPPEEAAG